MLRCMTTFIDLFAGLGGFRLGLAEQKYDCVFGADINKHAAKIYEQNFGDEILNDISKLDPKEVPGFDVLAGGFPCQPFSKAGATLGFDDTRGTLFFDVMRLIKHHQPRVVFLENVKNLASHDSGNTMKVIQDSLEAEGYSFSWKVLNAADFGVPQSRERVIIVAVKGGPVFDFSLVKTVDRIQLSSVLESSESEFEWLQASEYTLLDEGFVKTTPATGLRFAGYLNKNLRAGVNPEAVMHSRSHRQQNRIYSDEGTYCTLSSSEKSGRYYILTTKSDGSRGVRKLTIRECYRMFGYPNSYTLVGSSSEQYERIGNSICVPMVSAIAEQIQEQVFSKTKTL